MAKILMIIAPENFRDEELFDTKKELENSEHTIVIASTKKGTIFGSLGGKANAELLLSDINTKEYDAAVFVGGMGSQLLVENSEALKIAQDMHQDKKIVAAICLAPVILANAGILKNKKATATATAQKILESKGAQYIESGVVTDERIITASGPEFSRQFGQRITELLK